MLHNPFVEGIAPKRAFNFLSRGDAAQIKRGADVIDPGPARAFVRIADVTSQVRQADHGGTGPIFFRRLLDAAAFQSAIDFIDYSTIPPGSSIGRHEHDGNEEMYFIAAGAPLMTVDGRTRRLAAGDISIVRSGQWHQLVNDTTEPVDILVVQVRL